MGALAGAGPGLGMYGQSLRHLAFLQLGSDLRGGDLTYFGLVESLGPSVLRARETEDRLGRGTQPKEELRVNRNQESRFRYRFGLRLQDLRVIQRFWLGLQVNLDRTDKVPDYRQSLGHRRWHK